MAQNGYGNAMAGHVGRIPNFGKTQVNPMGNVEPPACIQNAMMTKDKKPFTYTPGGLDLSQIRTPSMARRMAKQRSLEEQEQAYAQQNAPNGNVRYQPQGGSIPPPPPPPQIPAPPPPPPLVIEVSKPKSPKPVPVGERPEIVIPDNPIGMLRKTNSPYHWEAEKAELQKIGPKFVEKVPSPLTIKMPPSSFSQQPPQTYSPVANVQRQNSYGRAPESPLHRPEAQYAPSPKASSSPQMRDLLQRQDSQFNKSPQPFASIGPSPVSNGSPFSPTPSNTWRQPERRDSPANSYSPQSPQLGRGAFSPSTQRSTPSYQSTSPSTNSTPVFHTLPRTNQRNQDSSSNHVQNNYNNGIYNNVNQDRPQNSAVDTNDATPWRANSQNKQSREIEVPQPAFKNQQAHSPQWKTNEPNNNNNEYIPPWAQERKSNNQNQQSSPPWVKQQNINSQENTEAPWRSNDGNNYKSAPSPQAYNEPPPEPRYQSTMSIPVTPRKQNTQAPQNSTPTQQKEIVYVNEEPVYYCPGPESPKSIPPWVKTQKEKTKTPPPIWCQRPLEPRKSLPRELVTPPKDVNQEPEWVRKSNEMQRGTREVISPPKYQQNVQPTWSTKPSDNRKSLPRDNAPPAQGSRVVPIQMEISNQGNDQRYDGGYMGQQQPQLRIVIGMQPPNEQNQGQNYSQPTQRIMRVLSPQLVRIDEPARQEIPSLNRSFQNNQENQPKTRIIPIQIEGGPSDGANKRIYFHKFTQEGPPRQSKSFRVLQVITGTQDLDEEAPRNVQRIEELNGFTDL